MEKALVARIKRVGKVGGAISAATVAIVAPLLILVYEVRGTAEGAKKGAEVGYETLAPAIAANQQDIQAGLRALADLGDSVGEAREHHQALQEELSVLQQRVVRCETYIEVLSRGRLRPASTPVAADPVRKAARMAEDLKEAFTQQPQDVANKIRRQTKTPVPTSLRRAKTYQQQRKRMKCLPDDPLCGAEAQ